MKQSFLAAFAVAVFLAGSGNAAAPPKAPKPSQAPPCACEVCECAVKALVKPAAPVPPMPRAEEPPAVTVEVKTMTRRQARVQGRRDARRGVVIIESSSYSAPSRQAPMQYSQPRRARGGSC